MLMDKTFMRHALGLAAKGWGRTNPNPLVGAVIVRDGRIIAEGCHARLGEVHAERAALRHAEQNRQDVHDATLYVNLEPCSHQGRTPPCTEAILASGIREVVVGMVDPAGARQRSAAARSVMPLTSSVMSLANTWKNFCKGHSPILIYLTQSLKKRPS